MWNIDRAIDYIAGSRCGVRADTWSKADTSQARRKSAVSDRRPRTGRASRGAAARSSSAPHRRREGYETGRAWVPQSSVTPRRVGASRRALAAPQVHSEHPVKTEGLEPSPGGHDRAAAAGAARQGDARQGPRCRPERNRVTREVRLRLPGRSRPIPHAVRVRDGEVGSAVTRCGSWSGPWMFCSRSCGYWAMSREPASPQFRLAPPPPRSGRRSRSQPFRRGRDPEPARLVLGFIHATWTPTR